MKLYWVLVPDGISLPIWAASMAEAIATYRTMGKELIGAVADGFQLSPAPRATASPLTVIIGQPAERGAAR